MRYLSLKPLINTISKLETKEIRIQVREKAYKNDLKCKSSLKLTIIIYEKASWSLYPKRYKDTNTQIHNIKFITHKANPVVQYIK